MYRKECYLYGKVIIQNEKIFFEGLLLEEGKAFRQKKGRGIRFLGGENGMLK